MSEDLTGEWVGRHDQLMIVKRPGPLDLWWVWDDRIDNELTYPGDYIEREWTRKPAAKPLLPWEEHPDAWWQSIDEPNGPTWHSASMASHAKPENWRRVLVVPADTHVAIPRELIEKARRLLPSQTFDGDGCDLLYAVQAILDAADEAS